VRCPTTVLPALVLLLECPASAQHAGHADPHEELLKVDREWAQAAATRDLERIVSYWTDDAVIYTPGEAPVAGKEAIRKYVSASLELPGFAIKWTPTRAEVSKAGDLGYTIGTNAITLPVAQGGSITIEGRYVTVWRKEQDGRWRCVIDTWNPAPAPSPPEPK
jgi:uncharacterized protein (TIGR02246 family)